MEKRQSAWYHNCEKKANVKKKKFEENQLTCDHVARGILTYHRPQI